MNLALQIKNMGQNPKSEKFHAYGLERDLPTIKKLIKGLTDLRQYHQSVVKFQRPD